MLVRKS